MSEFSKLNGYDVKDKKAIRYYDTVASMKADTTIKEGQYIKTKGYYISNDGGEGEYIITSIQNANEHQEELNNNLYATLINDVVNVKQFGAKGDGITDDTTSFQNAINYAYHLTSPSLYNSYKISIPKGKYLITSELTFTSSTLSGSEHSNIVVEGEGQGSSVIISNFLSNGSVFNLDASTKFSVKDISFKNTSNSDVKVTAISITNASMMIDLTNIFMYNFYIGIDGSICVGNITNCFANSCGCGFKINGTATNLLNCYASQCSVKSQSNPADYEGCGYYLDTVYSLLEACASDSNAIAYKVIRNGVTLHNCGMEGDTKGIVIETPNTNLYEAPITIDGYTYANISKPTIDIIRANKVIIKNHNFSLDFDYVRIASGLPTNVVEYVACSFYIVNGSLYPTPIMVDIDNIARTKGLIYNFDGYRNEGKGRLYQRTLKWRVTKTNTTTKLTNGRQVFLGIKIFTIQQYQDGARKTLNEEFSINYTVSGTYLAKTQANYDDTKFTFNTTSDDNYNYFEIVPSLDVAPENNNLCFDITVFDSRPFDLNHGSNLIEFENLDYTSV